jgi:DNA polymerase-3 subunit delta'
MPLPDVQHQEPALRRIQRALRAERIPHAYVFHGPEGVGKGLAARAFAGVLLCAAPRERSGADGSDGSPGAMLDACGECRDCRLMQAGTHPDYHPVYRELIKYHPDSTLRKRMAIDLSVDVIREFLIAPAAGTPACGRAKVFGVEEAERMTVSAQNALLKTLEEPPASTYIILLTSAIDRLLPTTRSRCQSVPFGPLPRAFVEQRLLAAAEDIADEEAHYLAAVSGGRLGPALHDHTDGLFALKQTLAEPTAELAHGGALDWAKSVLDAGKTLAESMSQRRKDASSSDLNRSALTRLLQSVASFFDDVLHLRADPGAAVANADQLDPVRQLAGRTDAGGAARAISLVAAAESHIDRNVNPALALEGLAAELCDCLARPQAR